MKMRYANCGDARWKMREKMDKGAQLKIQQMAFMLLAVTLFFVLVVLFVLMFKMAGLKKAATELEERNAMMLITKLANAPEFACGEVFSISTTGVANCVDADKVMVLKDEKMSNIYSGFWQVASIQIRKIYPIEDKIPCTWKNYPKCNLIEVYSRNVNSGPYYSNFISLCRKETFEGETYDKCELAKLLVSYEVKE